MENEDVSIIYNGDLVSINDLNLNYRNRAFRYGDGVFETIKILNGNVLFLKEHFDRLKSGINTLKIDLPSYCDLEYFEEKIKSLAEKNNIYENGIARIIVFRAELGKYTPETNTGNFIIETEKHSEKNEFVLNKKGKLIGIYDEILKPLNTLSSIKSNNALIYILAGVFAKSKGLDDALLLNENKNIIEATSSNLFIVDKNSIYTPALEEGCLPGVMRKNIIDLASKNKIKLYECQLNIEDLKSAEEIFLTNSNGITWVGGFEKKRYYCNVAKKINDLLNESIKASQQ
jgi:branched-chain amino acid aminotransferase